MPYGSLDLPEELVRRAEDVFFIDFGTTFDETNSAGDETTSTDAIRPGEDIRVEVMVVEILNHPAEAIQTANTDPTTGISVRTSVRHQVTTRGEFAETGGDDSLPAGTMFHGESESLLPLQYQDGTNSGAIGGETRDRQRHVVTPDALEVLSTREVDEGTAINAAWRLVSVPDGQINLNTRIWLFFSER